MAALFAWDQSTAFTVAAFAACILSAWLYHSLTRQYGRLGANADTDPGGGWISDYETDIYPQPPGLIAWAATMLPLSIAAWYMLNFSSSLMSDLGPVARVAQFVITAGPVLTSLHVLVCCGLLAYPHTATQTDTYRTRMQWAMIASAANTGPPLVVIWAFWHSPRLFYDSIFVFVCAVAYALQGRVGLHYLKRSSRESEVSIAIPQPNL